MEGGVGREKATCDDRRSFNEHLYSTGSNARRWAATRGTDLNRLWTPAPERAYSCVPIWSEF